jgi:putative oxidoreductase
VTMNARSKQTLEWIVTAVLACVFVAAGLTKLIGLPQQVDLFHQFGLPHWVLLLVGALEIVFAALLISRTTRSYGAMGLACVMIGASFAHIMAHVMLPMLFVNAALCFAAGWLVLRHRPEFLQVRRHA